MLYTQYLPRKCVVLKLGRKKGIVEEMNENGTETWYPLFYISHHPKRAVIMNNNIHLELMISSKYEKSHSSFGIFSHDTG